MSASDNKDTSDNTFFSKAIRSLGKSFSSVEEFAGYVVCGALIVFTMFWVTSEIIARFAFNYSFKGIVDFVILFIIAVAFLSLSIIQRGDAHVRMDLFDARLSKRRAGLTMQCLILVLAAITAIVLCYTTAKYALMSYNEQRGTLLIGYPYWPFAALIPIGLLFLTIRLGIQVKQLLGKIFLKA